MGKLACGRAVSSRSASQRGAASQQASRRQAGLGKPSSGHPVGKPVSVSHPAGKVDSSQPSAVHSSEHQGLWQLAHKHEQLNCNRHAGQVFPGKSGGCAVPGQRRHVQQA